MVLEFAMNNFQYLSLSLRRKLKYYLANEFTEIKMDKNIFCTEFVMEYMPYNLATVILSDILPRNATEDVSLVLNVHLFILFWNFSIFGIAISY